jgi:hypothetical protein
VVKPVVRREVAGHLQKAYGISERRACSGGEHWAIIASLVETCKLCGVDPQAYLADVLSRIVTGHRNTRLDDLLPWAYAATPDLKAVA